MCDEALGFFILPSILAKGVSYEIMKNRVGRKG